MQRWLNWRPASIKIGVTANGLAADVYMPQDLRGSASGVIVLGGSTAGMDERTAWQAKVLARHGHALGRFGGSPASNNAARIDSWSKVVAFIDAALNPSRGLQP
jgi:hypothetical protein